MTADDRENLIAYLVREGYLTNDLAYKGAEGRGENLSPRFHAEERCLFASLPHRIASPAKKNCLDSHG